MIPYEDLSRLLARELTPAEESALRARIRSEPEVAAAWSELQALVTDLAELDDPPPPAWLDAAVLAAAPQAAEVRPSRGPWLATAILMAAVFVLAVWPRPIARTTLVPAAGTQLVVGPVDVLVAQGHLLVDGTARVDVEPRQVVARGQLGKEVDMDRSALLAALTGAAVTVTVYEGQARWVGDDGTTRALAVGSTLTLGERTPPSPATAPVRVPPPVPRAAGTSDAQRVTELETENASLRQELERARLLHAVATGQLATYEGDPVPWPADVDAAWQPDPFRATIRQVAGDVGDMTVETVDCDEFPCIAVLSTPVKDDPMQIHALTRGLVDGMKATFPDGAEPPGVVLMVNQTTDDGESRAILSLAYAPEDDGDDTRTRFRAQRLVDEFNDPDAP